MPLPGLRTPTPAGTLPTHSAPRDPSDPAAVSATIIRCVGRLQTARASHGSSTCATFGRCIAPDTGFELRIGFSETNLIHSELSRSGHAPLLIRADDLRQVLLEQGWIESSHTERDGNANATELGIRPTTGIPSRRGMTQLPGKVVREVAVGDVRRT
jgi:hypothetical protein